MGAAGLADGRTRLRGTSSGGRSTVDSLSPTTLNAVGLLCNIVGAILLFLYGVPPHRPLEDAGKSFLLLEEDDHEQARRVFFSVEISKWAMLLLVVGFIVQFAALFR